MERMLQSHYITESFVSLHPNPLPQGRGLG